MNAKWKVISAVMLLIMIICAVFIGLLVKNCRVNLEKHIAEQVKSVQAIAQIIESQKSSQYQKRIKSLIDYQTIPAREKMMQAFARQDRAALLDLALPLFKILQNESVHFSTFGWVLPNNHAFLRVHNPAEFGEDISMMRPDVVTVNQTKRQVFGFTAGYVGLQYRIVQPVIYNGQHLGTIQFGLQESFILDSIQKKLAIPAGMVLPNETFQYVKRSKLINLPGKSHTIQARDVSLFQGRVNDIDWSQKQQRLVLHGKEYVVVQVLELRNFAKEVQGHLFVALDISEAIAKQRTLLWSTFSLSGVLLLISFLILNTSYGSLVQRIVNLNKSLEQNNRELEERVRERTQKLQQEMEERKIAEEKAQRASKMEAIGLMAGGVAHDLNNILSGITSYPELLLLELPDDSKLRKTVEAIQDSGRRAATVVSDLLTVARGVASDQHITNVNMLIHDYFDSPECQEMRSHYPQVLCRQEFGTDLLNISCSPVHVEKCLMNLVNNGLEAIGGEGELKVSTRNQYVDKPIAQNQYMEIGEYVVVTVVDSGTGIAKKDLEHIFEPFYTKKKMGRSGTGLGLAIVWNTMQDHGGAVIVASNEKGTRFELYFPGIREAVTTLAENTNIAELQGNGEQVLVVDDEAQQREIAMQMFSLLGYQVDSVSSGEEAVAYVQAKKVDLLLLDMIMGEGINGRETYEQIITVCPKQKAIIASGFSETEDVKSVQALGAGFFMRKPYTLNQLGMAAKQVLEGKYV